MLLPSFRPTLTLQGFLFWTLSALVVWAPIPFASNRPWSWALLDTALAALLILWAAGRVFGRVETGVSVRQIAVPGALFALVAVIVVVQASCWTPAGWHHPIWSLVDSLPEAPGCPAITIERFETWTALARLLGWGAAFWLAAQLLSDAARARTMVKLIAFVIAVNAAYGLFLHFAGLDYILWFEKWAYKDAVTGTFVNRNAFAAFVGMGAVCNLAIVVHGMLEGSERRRSMRRETRLSADELLTRFYPYITGFVLCLTATILTASRAGVGATFLGLIALVVTAGIHHGRSWNLQIVGAALAAGILIIGVAAGGGRLLERLEDTVEHAENRSVVIGATLEAAAERPWFGVGYGTFEEAWPMYRPPGVNFIFRQAHSTYAENLLELGLPGAVALSLTVAWLFGICAHGLVRRKRDGLFPSVAISAALIPIVHSMIDFSMQIPAVVFFVVVLLAMGVAQSSPSRSRRAQTLAAAGVIDTSA